jgi:hypothetical protein
MANGQVALVRTEGLRGEPSTRVVYFVAEEDPGKAEAIIGAVMAPNERVEAWGPLPEAAVKAIGLKPGEFRHFPRDAKPRSSRGSGSRRREATYHIGSSRQTGCHGA